MREDFGPTPVTSVNGPATNRFDVFLKDGPLLVCETIWAKIMAWLATIGKPHGVDKYPVSDRYELVFILGHFPLPERCIFFFDRFEFFDQSGLGLLRCQDDLLEVNDCGIAFRRIVDVLDALSDIERSL